jgi:prepilin-type N-terminal cleavage/methylation domain-containing protein
MPAPKTRPPGFTLLELTVVVVVVAVLIAVALDRLLRYAELAERAAMEQSISAMKSALGLRFAALYLRGRVGAIQALPEENPMDWLAERPPGYLGELWGPALETLERPSWYFDRARRELVYAPLRTRYLVPSRANDPRIRYRVIVDFAPGPDFGGAAELRRLGMEPTEPYNWFQDR